MSDYGGAMLGAMMLSHQISSDRFMDGLRRDREISDLQRNDAAWQDQYNQLAAHYNRLVDELARLSYSKVRAQEAEKKCVDLEQHINNLEFKYAGLLQKVVRLETKLKSADEELIEAFDKIDEYRTMYIKELLRDVE